MDGLSPPMQTEYDSTNATSNSGYSALLRPRPLNLRARIMLKSVEVASGHFLLMNIDMENIRLEHNERLFDSALEAHLCSCTH